MDDREELGKFIVNFWDRTGDLFTEQELAEAILESEWLRKHDEAVWDAGYLQSQHDHDCNGRSADPANPYTQK
jgi:hypothetical protein